MYQHTHNRVGHLHGFTLVELILTLILVGVLAATALPRLTSIDLFSERGFADDLVSAARYAQKVAIASDCPVRMSISATGYSIYRPANRAACAIPTFAAALTLPDGSGPYSGTAPNNSTLSPVTNIDFNGAGATSITTTISLNGTPIITVHAGSGYVERN